MIEKEEAIKIFQDKLNTMEHGAICCNFGIDKDAFLLALQLLKQEPCEDCISRQAVLDLVNADWKYEGLEEPINSLSPVNPQKPICPSAGIDCEDCPAYEPKIGRWIEDAKTYYEELNKRGLGVDEYTPYFTDDIACSECLAKYSMLDNETQFFKHCPNCGAKMTENEQKPKSEWEHDHEILKAYSNGASAVIDKIRAEIEQEYNHLSATRADETLELGECLGLKMSLKIIDKYKAEGSGE